VYRLLHVPTCLTFNNSTWCSHCVYVLYGTQEKLQHLSDWGLFFSFGVLQFMLPEAPQPYGLLYYPHIGLSNFLKFRAATSPKQRKLEF
jgi:hypothetical protein